MVHHTGVVLLLHACEGVTIATPLESGCAPVAGGRLLDGSRERKLVYIPARATRHVLPTPT